MQIGAQLRARRRRGRAAGSPTPRRRHQLLVCSILDCSCFMVQLVAHSSIARSTGGSDNEHYRDHTEALPAGTWTLDPVHSHVGFAVDYVGGTFRGSFSPVEARLEVTEDGSASLTGSAPVAGVKVQDENLRRTSSRPTSSTPSARRRSRFTLERRSAVDGDEVEVDGRAHDQGRHAPGAPRRARSASRSTTRSAASASGSTLETQIDRTAFRPELEQPAPERRAVARERRDPHRRAVLRRRRRRSDEGPRNLRQPPRRDSHNTQALLAAAELLPAGRRARALRRAEGHAAVRRGRRRPAGAGGRRALPRAIAGADALLFATPEYNSSVPGQLKNALDWASRPLATNVLRNKPVAVVGASTGAFGAVWAQAELRKVLAATGARVVDVEVAVGHARERFDERGRLTDENLSEELARGRGDPRRRRPRPRARRRLIP